jgi:type IV pilus assembly protein PilE
MRRACRRIAGFTLIELTIALAIVAVLTSLAVPSYQSVVRKSRRTEAQAALLDLALRQERWRSDHASYAPASSEIGAGAWDRRLGRYYRLEVVGTTATSFTVQAAAVSGQGQEHDQQGSVPCSTLGIDQSGVRSPSACW